MHIYRYVKRNLFLMLNKKIKKLIKLSFLCCLVQIHSQAKGEQIMISHIKALVLVLGGGRAALNSCSKSVLAVRLSTQTIPAAQTKEEADWFKQITADNGRRPVNFSTRLLWSKNSSYSDLSDEEKLAAINLMWQERIATFQSAPKLLTEKHIAALKRCQGYTHMKETFT